MKTTTSTEGHLNMAIQSIRDQMPKIRRLEQIETVARRVVSTYDNGCSFEDLSPLISALGRALKLESPNT